MFFNRTTSAGNRKTYFILFHYTLLWYIVISHFIVHADVLSYGAKNKLFYYFIYLFIGCVQVRSARAVEDLQRKELEDQLEAEAYFSGLYKTQVRYCQPCTPVSYFRPPAGGSAGGRCLLLRLIQDPGTASHTNLVFPDPVPVCVFHLHLLRLIQDPGTASCSNLVFPDAVPLSCSVRSARIS